MPFNAVLKVILVLAIYCFSQISYAHLQWFSTDTTITEEAAPVPAKMIFWHPMGNSHIMDMQRPLQVSVIHRGQRTDVTADITQTRFIDQNNTAISWDVIIPVKRSNNYVIMVTLEPYYEAYLNRNQLPTDWHKVQGLKAEIRSLVKPYNVAVGTSFRGQVLSEGQPVLFSEIEVDYMPAPPDMATGNANFSASLELLSGSISLLSDAHSVLGMAIPEAGYWDFAALEVGLDGHYQGKKLSQNAVI